MTGASLAGPLERSLYYADPIFGVEPRRPSTTVRAAEILAALRSDPEVLAAMAEAVQRARHADICDGSESHHHGDCSGGRYAALILDALLGVDDAPPRGASPSWVPGDGDPR